MGLEMVTSLFVRDSKKVFETTEYFTWLPTIMSAENRPNKTKNNFLNQKVDK